MVIVKVIIHSIIAGTFPYLVFFLFRKLFYVLMSDTSCGDTPICALAAVPVLILLLVLTIVAGIVYLFISFKKSGIIRPLATVLLGTVFLLQFIFLLYFLSDYQYLYLIVSYPLAFGLSSVFYSRILPIFERR